MDPRPYMGGEGEQVMITPVEFFSRTDEGVYSVDSDRTIVYWNDAAEALLGYTADEAMGKSCWQLLRGQRLHGEVHCSDHCEVRARAARGESLEDFDVIVKHAEGHDVPIRVLPLYASAGDEGVSADEPLLHLFHRLVATQPIADDRLRISLLGSIRVTRSDGTHVAGDLWKRVKVRALLAALVGQLERSISREELVELLWPDLDYQSALKNLNTTVYNLRRSLEPNLRRGRDSRYILYESGHYRFSGNHDCWLDVDAFEQGIRSARRSADPESRIEYYQQALSLYRGDYLSDLRYTEVWSSGQNDRYQSLYLNGMEELGALCEETGRGAEAEDLYLQVLAVDPCRECAFRRLVQLLLRQGRRADAVGRCEQLRRTLRQELDVEPSEDICVTCEEARLLNSART